MKVISFVIPSYNSERFLDKCMTSFLEESVLDEIEVIIVNDGSRDATEEIAKKYVQRYPNSIRLISQQNRGHGGALNAGIAAAEGRYVKPVDADDWVDTRSLPEFVRRLKTLDSDVVLTHHYTIDVGTGEQKKWMSYPKAFSVPMTMETIMESWDDFSRSFCFHGITYKTEFYRGCNIPLSEHVFYEDYEFATMACCRAASVSVLDLFIYHYRIGDVQQSVSEENQLKRLGHVETVLNRFLSEYEALELPAGSGGHEYFCRKAQELLLSYLTTTMLVKKEKKEGRLLGSAMMCAFRERMPRVWEMAKKKYAAYRVMNRLHISKQTFEKFLHSNLIQKLRHKRDFN